MTDLTREQWNNLRYTIQLRQLSEEEGGGWIAWIPVLGRGMFTADGDTVAETVAKLEALRRENYDLVKRSRTPVPLPED